MLVYMVLNGKGFLWLWTTWGQSCFYSFLTGVNPIQLFVFKSTYLLLYVMKYGICILLNVILLKVVAEFGIKLL